MLFQLRSYLKFLIKSSNQHGVHSPFVFDLVRYCFYDTNYKPWYDQLKKYKYLLIKNKSTIVIEDFGAGSKRLENKQRKVSKIAKNAGITFKRAKLLGRLTAYLQANKILEIGTSLGISTASLHLSNPKTTITTLEGCRATAQIAKDSFDKFNFKNINMVLGNFNETLPKVIEDKTYDLIYFDGNHQKEPTINYFEQCLEHIHNDSVFIFDDIYWSKGMQEAWQYIKDHSKVTISIDTFYWGIVFFRKEQEKEHFTIRM